MSFVIVLDKTNVIVATRTYGKDQYATEAAAKAGATRLVQKGKLEPGTFTIYDINSMPSKTHTVTNLMTGKQVKEDVNTPYCCSVASESYWAN